MVILFVPGRICLFGEHSDWAGGYRRVNPAIRRGRTLIVGTEQGIYAHVAPHPGTLAITATTPDGTRRGPVEIPMQAEALLAQARTGDFWSYAAGTAYQMLTRFGVDGLRIDNFRTTLPVKKGLSSSAAICVLVARAFNRVYNLGLSVRDEMELAYQGEITTPSRCGRMDQGCAFGGRPLLMTFDGDDLYTEEVMPGGAIHLVLVDLGAQKDTQRILADLNSAYPVARTAIHQGVQELLGPINERIVDEAQQALKAGDAQRLGELMTEAQALFDRCAMPASPQELAAPILHRVLSYPALGPHIWGGKGVGSQGDGSAQFVARSRADQQAVIDILRQELGLSAIALTIGGSSPVRRALIPAAGFGTRMFPASKAVRKEFFPVVGRDGIARPAILLIVEEALSAGVEDVVIIVQPEDRPLFEGFFHQPISPEQYARLPEPLRRSADRLAEIGARVSFVEQDRQDGFGHAVYCARDAVGDGAFLLLLGDHLYHTTGPLSCAAQLMEAYREHGADLVGLQVEPEDQLAHRGVVAGAWREPGRLLEIAHFIEKPSPEEGRRRARVEGLPDGHYLALSGQYILSPQIFDLLGRSIEEGRRERGEYQLTTALDLLCRQGEFLGLVVDGKTYDIGQPGLYLGTLQALSG
ncbi:MAG: hypothetical protein Kow00124_09570 [Anaerolineae bacterium]